MPVFQPQERQTLQQKLNVELKNNINLTLYTQGNSPLFIPGRECRTCKPTQELIEEISTLSPKIYLEIVDFHNQSKNASDNGIKRIPALKIDNGNKGQATFYGMPSGLGFTILLDSIICSSTRRTNLDLETRKKLRRLPEKTNIQVFVAPSCQYSPSTAYIAIQMAMESPKITVDIIQVQEYPDLAHKHSVRAVPKTVINNQYLITGAASEQVLLDHVLRSVGAEETNEDETSIVTDKLTMITSI